MIMGQYRDSSMYSKPRYYEINDGRVWSVERAMFIAKENDEDYQSFIAGGNATIKAPDKQGKNTAEGLRECLKFYGYEQGELELPEEKKERMKKEACEQSNMILDNMLKSNLLQTASFDTATITTFAIGDMYPAWQSDTVYSKGTRLSYQGVVYEVVQEARSIESQTPADEGMLAIYRPISSSEGKGTEVSPFAFIYGMDVHANEYYTYNGKMYKATGDMLPCTWYPGTVGVFQWQEI